MNDAFVPVLGGESLITPYCYPFSTFTHKNLSMDYQCHLNYDRTLGSLLNAHFEYLVLQSCSSSSDITN